MEFKDRTMLHCFWEVKYQKVVSSTQNLQAGLSSLVYVKGLWMIKLMLAVFFPLGVGAKLGNQST